MYPESLWSKMMKSHELAKLLLENPDVELICQKDGEGNGYSPLRGVDFDVIYVADTTYSGNVYDTSWTADDCGMEEKEWKELKETNAGYAVLYPIN
jgi:hypothetical protein